MKSLCNAQGIKPELIVVAISNLDSKLISKRAMEAGVNECLEKDCIAKSVLSGLIDHYKENYKAKILGVNQEKHEEDYYSNNLAWHIFQ